MKCALLICILPHLFNNCYSKQYRVLLTRLEICKDPALPYVSPVPFELILNIYNSSKGFSLIRGNLTAPKDIPGRDLRGTFAYGVVTRTGVKWTATLKELTCNSFVAKMIIGSYGIPLKGCMLKKGVYVFKDVDVDAMDSAFLAGPPRAYGSFVTRATIHSKNETLLCWVCHIKISPFRKE